MIGSAIPMVVPPARPQLGYRNTTVYSSYTAASFADLISGRRQVNLEGGSRGHSNSRASHTSRDFGQRAVELICRC